MTPTEAASIVPGTMRSLSINMMYVLRPEQYAHDMAEFEQLGVTKANAQTKVEALAEDRIKRAAQCVGIAVVGKEFRFQASADQQITLDACSERFLEHAADGILGETAQAVRDSNPFSDHIARIAIHNLWTPRGQETGSRQLRAFFSAQRQSQ